MNIVVIIPTYNEVRAIASLLDALEVECRAIPGHTMKILIVDGNSSDGTLDEVRRKTGEYANIFLLVEKEKRGLGMAYIEGMNYAVRKLDAGAVIEFDGDFQHDPKDIPRLVAELDKGFDYVIGSRYVPGGAVPKEWGWHRKLLSKFGSLFIKYVLWLPTNDNTSGLKLTRVHPFFEYLPLSENAILSRRHAYKVHLLYEMVSRGAKIKEIPIVFLERGGGVSKSSIEDIKESLLVTGTLFLRKLMRK
jgi:dolichol-phosphate mannosyltransferase